MLTKPCTRFLSASFPSVILGKRHSSTAFLTHNSGFIAQHPARCLQLHSPALAAASPPTAHESPRAGHNLALTGMSENILRHAAHDQSRTMTTTAAQPPPLFAAPSMAKKQHPPLCPTDEEALVPHKDQQRGRRPSKVDKQSLEYLVKSGFAGGLAGCAVWTLSPLEPHHHY